MEKRAFGELELAVLQVMKSGGKMTVKEVNHRLGSKDKYNTIMTVMARLAAKKVLLRERIGLQYQYWLKETIPNFLKKRVLGIEPAQLMCYLCESVDLISDDELLQMEKILEKAKLERKKRS